MQNKKIFINYNLKNSTLLNDEFLTNQLYLKNDVL